MSDQTGQGISEAELRALEAELDRITVDEVILQTIVSLINLGARKGAVGAPPEAGLTPDFEQLRTAIEAARGLLAIVEPRHRDAVAPIRNALSQLQVAYARGVGSAPGGEPGPEAGGRPEPQGGQGGAGPAQRSGRLWIPGQ